jgi:predicted RNA polymerase sigma factor
MTAILSRIFGLQHLDLILDIVQDTFEAALTGWRFSGIPDNPSGWLMKVAKNKALNAVKRAQRANHFLLISFYRHPMIWRIILTGSVQIMKLKTVSSAC